MVETNTAKKVVGKLVRKLGQTSIEYVLVIMVVAGIAYSAFHLIKSKWLGPKGSLTDKMTNFLHLEPSNGQSSSNFKRYQLPH